GPGRGRTRRVDRGGRAGAAGGAGHPDQPGRADPRTPGAHHRHGRIAGVTVPNVLAARYASAELVALWSPEEKVRMERRLWNAVLAAQRDLGVAVPEGAVEAYEAVVDDVDLDR